MLDLKDWKVDLGLKVGKRYTSVLLHRKQAPRGFGVDKTGQWDLEDAKKTS